MGHSLGILLFTTDGTIGRPAPNCKIICPDYNFAAVNLSCAANKIRRAEIIKFTIFVGGLTCQCPGFVKATGVKKCFYPLSDRQLSLGPVFFDPLSTTHCPGHFFSPQKFINLWLPGHFSPPQRCFSSVNRDFAKFYIFFSMKQIDLANYMPGRKDVSLSVVKNLTGLDKKTDHLKRCPAFYEQVYQNDSALVTFRTRQPINITIAVIARGTATSPKIILCK